MRRRLIIYAIFFILVILAVQCVDVITRFDVGIFDYIRYSAPITSDEAELLKSRDMDFGIDTANSPYSFTADDTGQPTGIIVDYFNQLAVALETDMHPVGSNSFNLPLELKSGKTDMAVLNRNDMNNSVFSFTQTLYKERSKVLVDGESSYENISDIRDISIAVISGSAAHHAANKFFTESNNVDIVLTDSLDESFTLLGLGQVDAIIGDEAKISYHLNQALRSNRFKFVEGSVSEEDVAIAVNPEDEELLDILNKGILVMKKNDQYSHINSKWFGSFIPEINESTASGRTANLLSVTIVLFGIFFLWNKSVANKVNVRTMELNESRQDLRDMIDSLDMGIMVSDSRGRVVAVNRALNFILGTEYSDLLDKKREEIGELRPFLERENMQDAFFYNGKYYLVYSKKLNRDSTSDILLIEDYTDRQNYESLNRQEAKMIAVGELTAGLAHEIRNPLGLIKSYLFLLRKKIEGDSEKHAMEVMDDSVNRINSLIENMLGFSRLSMEEAKYVDIGQSVSSVVALEKDNMDKHQIRLNMDIGPGADGQLKINEDVLRLCIVNLTNNSLDAFRECDKEDKTINIRADSDGERLKIVFEDNATGIPREKLDMIFDPFYTTKDNGTGLGLYILQSEIRKIGGSLTVDSEEGRGTAFEVILPVEKEREDGEN